MGTREEAQHATPNDDTVWYLPFAVAQGGAVIVRPDRFVPG
jgi:hypothetical protein